MRYHGALSSFNSARGTRPRRRPSRRNVSARQLDFWSPTGLLARLLRQGIEARLLLVRQRVVEAEQRRTYVVHRLLGGREPLAHGVEARARAFRRARWAGSLQELGRPARSTLQVIERELLLLVGLYRGGDLLGGHIGELLVPVAAQVRIALLALGHAVKPLLLLGRQAVGKGGQRLLHGGESFRHAGQAFLQLVEPAHGGECRIVGTGRLENTFGLGGCCRQRLERSHLLLIRLHRILDLAQRERADARGKAAADASVMLARCWVMISGPPL